MTTEPGKCIHVPPSRGQAMCECGHRARELAFAFAIFLRAARERASR